jgi:dTDP-4-dehydrorhamnose reductase
MTCGGSTSWYGFAQAIFAHAAAQLGVQAPELSPIPTKNYSTAAARPRNSVLSNEKLGERFGLQLPSWESGLEEVVEVLRGQSPQ